MPAIDIGNRRELFVDRHLIDRLSGASLRLHEPVRREVVFQAQAPLENACTACYNLTQDGDRILLYYRGYHPVGVDLPAGWEQSQTANLLISADGIRFERPDLGLVEVDGSKHNNIVYRGYEGHNFCVFADRNPAAPPAQRFKAIGGAARNNLHGFGSPDGIHWSRLQQGPLAITGAFDSVNVAFWDSHAERYRIFSRYFHKDADGKGVRAIQSCSSEDFIHWTDPAPHVYEEGVPLEHFYTNATTPCPGATHILLSFPMRFVPERTKNIQDMDYPGEGISDAVFMSSRDGVRWDRTFMEAWLRPGADPRNWTHRNQTPAAGIVVTGPDEWSMYVCEHYGWNTNRLRRLSIRPHGFASLHAGWGGGEMVTNLLMFSGSGLYLNYATSAVGSVLVEVQDVEGKPVDGFALTDMAPMFGDDQDAAVAWRGGSLDRLNGTPVRLRFALRDADVFAIQVR